VAKHHHKKAYNILTNYYWAPEGTAGLQNIVTLGRKHTTPHCIKSNQIFSLGMTLLHLCLMRPLYQSETFSEKKINAYLKEASAVRKSQGLALSNELLGIMKRMLAWDAEERIDYSELAHQVTTRNSQSMLTS
jgi:serine/threonine protein kinase